MNHRKLSRRYGHAASKTMQIVLARVVDDFEVVQRGRVDLGERHKTRDLKVARALMWKKGVKPEALDAAMAKAATFARESGEGYVPFAYPSSDRDVLNHAKRDLLKHLGIGSDVGRIYMGPDKPFAMP